MDRYVREEGMEEDGIMRSIMVMVKVISGLVEYVLYWCYMANGPFNSELLWIQTGGVTVGLNRSGLGHFLSLQHHWSH